jgi:hypothetical protein
VPENNNLQELDALTGGAFSAPTSGERSTLLRQFLISGPKFEQLQAVYKEMSVKDKGAAKLLRERLDDIRRTRAQETMAAEWAAKAQELLEASRLNLADAMAWQREAAKAGAPLGREPLAALKLQLADRIKAVENLQHSVQVQKEVAVLLAQRIEVLSTKPWQDAQSAREPLAQDVSGWDAQTQTLRNHPHWVSVDARFAAQLDASAAQMRVVWEAFSDALSQTEAAASNLQLPLPAVPVWADALRAQRQSAGQTQVPARSNKPSVDPQVLAQAQEAVQQALGRLEQEMTEGHGKASVAAATALRQALKDHGRWVSGALESQVHAALAAADELEGWQRWRADQLRQELVKQAEGLLNRPEGQALGGRKTQETLRHLREQWKTVDQGGVPNHLLWRRFDEACNAAFKVVEVWLEKIKAEAAEHRAQREALMAELSAWAQANTGGPGTDWKLINRDLHEFSERWRDAGHLSEKAFAELQPRWKALMAAASAPIEALQRASVERRQAMIAEAQALGEAPMLQIGAVKNLQKRWQSEAHTVPLDRRQEQKLWDAFRKPIDDAFNRKSAEREKAAFALSARDLAVLQASEAVQTASQSGDAGAIRAALQQLDALLRGEVPVDVRADVQAVVSDDAPQENLQAVTHQPAVSQKPAKPIVAVRGDDRPGVKRSEPEVPRGRPKRDPRPERGPAAPALPRLGDQALRAHRYAIDQAQLVLRKLAAQAHGESLTKLLQAWSQRSSESMPTVQELGSRVTPAMRILWSQTISTAPVADASSEALRTALLRLEMAAEVPTPAEDLEARRALQLQLLTRRNDPSPVQTWGQDVARVFASPWDEAQSRRLQHALKVLIRKT